MQREARKYLFDIRRATGLIVGFCSDRTFEDYAGDDMLKSAVERQFGVGVREQSPHLACFRSARR